MMSKLERAGKRALAETAMSLLGRRTLARLGRFLSNEARLDTLNEITENGEAAVQRAVLIGTAPTVELVIVDVGANVGDWTGQVLSAADQLRPSNLRVFALEPAGRTFGLLKRRLGQESRVTLVNKGASDAEGTATLHVPPDRAAGTSSLHGESVGGPTSETVALTTIDSFCAGHGLDHLHLVKIDTEGHDLLVLRGATRMLSQRAIEVIQFEYNHRWVYARQFLRDAFELLQPLGYQLGKVTSQGIERYGAWHPELETFREGNYLAYLPSWEARLPTIAWWNEGAP